MNYDMVRIQLEQTAERMMELANHLGNGMGRPMTQMELGLARAAMVPAVMEVVDSIVVDMLRGVTCHERVAEELSQLEIL